MTSLARATARLACATLALLATSLAAAQQRPLTGQMLGDTALPRGVSAAAADTRPPPDPEPLPPLPPQPPSATLPPAPAPRLQVGDATRALLRLQSSGRQAGARLPMLGDQASLSYARYLQSFTHPIPEFLDTRVREAISGSGSAD
ncbi:DUF3613 domain-containing protein [Stenotrophomonas sp.]|uniref:DUF3613 domain-containing protein n=1 Tax=Stenotrophomonas sp. TaxID=69392 RepID=UPI002FC675F4